MVVNLRAFLDRIVQVEWLSVALTAAAVFAVTFVVSRFAVKFLRHVLSRDSSPLPSSSIFVNIVRVVIWMIGASIVLSTCFGIDVSAAITALGIGGIAISLGFQDTLSNLIGGLQVSLTGLVEPGDNIEVGGERGIVQDVTWRHTTIENSLGERVVIPNSIINKTALVKLRPLSAVSIPVVVTVDGEKLTETAELMRAAADKAASGVCALEKESRVLFSEVTDYGYRGTLTFAVADSSEAAAAKDAVLRAIAPLVHSGQSA